MQIAPHLKFLLHSQAGLWQNAWFTPEPGIILIFNLVSVVEYLFLLLGLGFVARTALWR